MAFLDQINLANHPQFQQRVQAAIVHAALAIGSEIASDIQTLSITGTATGGTFTLTFGGQTTATINWNDSAGSVQLKLQALTTVGAGNVACTGGPLPGTPVGITFMGTLSGAAQAAITIGTNSLTGTSPVPVIAHSTVGSSVINHTKRSALATAILLNARGYAELMAIGITDNATIMTDVNIATLASTGALTLNVTEAAFNSDIQFATNSIFNAYAGV